MGSGASRTSGKLNIQIDQQQNTTHKCQPTVTQRLSSFICWKHGQAPVLFYMLSFFHLFHKYNGVDERVLLSSSLLWRGQ